MCVIHLIVRVQPTQCLAVLGLFVIHALHLIVPGGMPSAFYAIEPGVLEHMVHTLMPGLLT